MSSFEPTSSPDLEVCPFHAGVSTAGDRTAIKDELEGVLTPFTVSLAERVGDYMQTPLLEGADTPLQAILGQKVHHRPYDAVRAGYIYTETTLRFATEVEHSAVVGAATGKFAACMETSIGGLSVVDAHPVRIPVGHDRQYARVQTLAAAGVVKAVVPLLRPEVQRALYNAQGAPTAAGELILRHTYQGYTHPEGDPADAALRILQQGAILTAQAEAVLTADEVPGYTPEQLSELLRKGLLSEFVRRAGSGMLSTLVRHGVRVPHPVAVDAAGNAELTSPLIAYETATRRDATRQIIDSSRKLSAELDSAENAARVAAALAVGAPSVASIIVPDTAGLHYHAHSGAVCPVASAGVASMANALATVRQQLWPHIATV